MRISLQSRGCSGNAGTVLRIVRNSRDDAAIDCSESHYSGGEMEEKWRTFDDKRYNGKFATRRSSYKN